MLGKTATVTAAVTSENTAGAVGSGSLEVFATPMMAALMERAACACLADGLAPGQTSVGTHICVDHVAASPLGMEVAATATVTAVHGRSVEFEVYARDDVEEVGRGRHVRVIVDEERFMGKARAKGAGL